MKARTHRVTLTVTFDKPCTRKVAVAEVRDNIHGLFFASGAGLPKWESWAPGYPEEFKVRSVRSAK
jgi:hypothetical protein